MLGLLYPAMRAGENIHVKGEISAQLLRSLNHDVILFLKKFDTTLNSIQITADATNSQNFQGKGIGTGFSGGVDSFSTLLDRYISEDSQEKKLNGLLFLNVGSHGWGEGLDKQECAHKLFLARYKYLHTFTEEIGLPFIQIGSNLHSFYPEGHQKTHTLTAIAAVLAMQKFFCRYYYASSGLNHSQIEKFSTRYRGIDIGAYGDPTLLPLLSTEALVFQDDGTQYTRVEKIKKIANYEPTYRFLNVCVAWNVSVTWRKNSVENCSACPKCWRTIMPLKIIGKAKDFDSVFDLNKYQNEHEHSFQISQVINQYIDPFASSIIALAKSHKYRIPGLFKYKIVTLLKKILRLQRSI